MYLCYIDESGTSDIPGTTSHFILAGLSIPVWHWSDCDHDILALKAKYDLSEAEIHTGWIIKGYIEQNKILNFESLNYDQRRYEVKKYRTARILKIQKEGNTKKHKQTKKSYLKTNDYVHLTFDERKRFIKELANCIAKWGFARLFAECIDKIYFDPARSGRSVDEQALEQIVSRFEQYLESISNEGSQRYGLLIHDNNETVNNKHTLLMKQFHKSGTLWTHIKHIIETPLFVDSGLTSMVQIADLCSYAIRRYLENGEEELFDLIFTRADRKHGISVGVRHFTENSCSCKICNEHKK